MKSAILLAFLFTSALSTFAQPSHIISPNFRGEALPPEYEGKSLDELLRSSPHAIPAFEGQAQLDAETCKSLDDSPELLIHPALTALVEQLNSGGVAERALRIANYVSNEIELCDPLGIPPSSETQPSINEGGVKRGALAVYMAKQGSPTEQCALLVYLLRAAGVPAVYVEPRVNSMKMLDQQLSRMLRMQIKGMAENIQDSPNRAGTTAKLISVNYPWVAIYVGDNKWVNVFPWIKDTEVVEGRELYESLAEAGLPDAVEWVKRYVRGEVELLNLDSENNTPASIFPKYIDEKLKAGNRGFTLADIGVRFRDRKHLYNDWSEFPRPYRVEEAPRCHKNLKAFDPDNDDRIFDTVKIEVIRPEEKNGDNVVTREEVPFFDTGELRALDLHNRRLIIRHENIRPLNQEADSEDGIKTAKSGNSSVIDFETVPVGIEGTSSAIKLPKQSVATTAVATLKQNPDRCFETEPSPDDTSGNPVYSSTYSVPADQHQTVKVHLVGLGTSFGTKKAKLQVVVSKSDDPNVSRNFLYELRGYLARPPSIPTATFGVDKPGNDQSEDVAIENRDPNRKLTIKRVSVVRFTEDDLSENDDFTPNSNDVDQFVIQNADKVRNKTLKYGASALLKIKYRRSNSGHHRAKLKVEYVYDDARPGDEFAVYNGLLDGAAFNALGVGVDFGTGGVGNSQQGTATLKNLNDRSLEIVSVELRGKNAGRFEFISGNTSGNLAKAGDDNDTRKIVIRSKADQGADLPFEANIEIKVRLDGLETKYYLPLKAKIEKDNDCKLMLTLAPFRPGVQDDWGDFSAEDQFLLQKQRKTQRIKSQDNTADLNGLEVRVTYKRHRARGERGHFLQPGINDIGTYDKIESSRPFGLGDTVALCLNFGRVTPEMIDVHAREFWSLEKEIQKNEENSDYEPDLDVFYGTPMYIMGLSYYKQVGDFDQFNQNLHKVRKLSNFSCGLAKLSARRPNGKLPGGEIVLKQPGVDMPSFEIVALANSSLHPNRNLPGYDANYQAMAIADGSAQEHQIIDQFFRKRETVSTVRLLQTSTKNGCPIVEVVVNSKAEFDKAGEELYMNGQVTTGAEGQTLSSFDSALWEVIEKRYVNVGDFPFRMLLTPGLVEVSKEGASSPFYSGMGALIFASSGNAALISGNRITGERTPENGGFGSEIAGYSVANSPSVSLTTTTVVASAVTVSESGAVTHTQFYGMSFVKSETVSTGGDFPVLINRTTTFTAVAIQSSTSYPDNEFQTEFRQDTRELLAMPPSDFNIAEQRQESLQRGVISPGITFDPFNKVADPVNLITGEFYHDEFDLVIPGPFPIELRRNYTSKTKSDNYFGYGWKPNHLPYLSISTDNDKIYAAEMDGSVVVYKRVREESRFFKPEPALNPTLNNVARTGMFGGVNLLESVIERDQNEKIPTYILRSSDGSYRVFKLRSYTVSGIEYKRPYLVEWSDNSGNKLRYEFFDTGSDAGLLSKIISSTGGYLGFVYDVFGHITEAYTGDGRRVYYRYDGHGDLVEVTKPDGSKVAYEYQHKLDEKSQVFSTHLLVREIRPQGRILKNQYDGRRRVERQWANLEGGDLVLTGSFTYSDPTGKKYTSNTITTDADGKATLYVYEDGQITKIRDAEGIEEKMTWFPSTTPRAGNNGKYPRSLWKSTDRRGLDRIFTYDGRGNVLTERVSGSLTGKTDSSGKLITNDYTIRSNYDYDDGRVVLSDRTDASGNTTFFEYEQSANYPYLPTLVTTKSGTTVLSRTKYVYGEVESGNRFAKGLLKSVHHAEGFAEESVTRWDYDVRGFPTSVSTETGTEDPTVGKDLKFNARGELVEEVDKANRATHYAYDGLGRLIWTERRDEAGKLVAWNYDYINPNGEVEWSDGPMYSPEDYVWRRYDQAGRLKDQTVWRSKLNEAGNSVEARTGDSQYAVTRFRYDKKNNLTQIVDPRNNATVMRYDAIGRLTALFRYDGEYSAAAPETNLKSEVSMAYAPGGEVAVYTDPLGVKTRRFYTQTGQIRLQKNPDGTELVWHYREDGRPIRVPETTKTHWEIVYDDPAREITRTLKNSISNATISPLKRVVERFDRLGRRVELVDAGGHLFERKYDRLGRIIRTKGPATANAAAQVVTIHYPDGAGVTVKTVNQKNEESVTKRDALGRVESSSIFAAPESGEASLVWKRSVEFSPDHHSATTTLGVGGEALASTSFFGSSGELLGTRDGDLGITRYEYDVGGNLVGVTDPANQKTSYEYDGLERLSRSTLPDEAKLEWFYNAAGSLRQRTMPNGMREEIKFDNLGRASNRKLVDAAEVPTRQTTYTYYPEGNDLGNIATLTEKRSKDQSIVHTYFYDECQRVEKLKSEGYAGSPTVTQTRGYDTRDYLTHLELRYPASSDYPDSLVTREFDAYGQLTEEWVRVSDLSEERSWNTHSKITQEWNHVGRRVGLSAPNLPEAAPEFGFSYFADGQLSGLTAGGRSASYEYTTAGLLDVRKNPWRDAYFSQRNGRGLATERKVFKNGSETELLLRESMGDAANPGYRADGKLSSYSAERTGYPISNDVRSYIYDVRGHLTSETYRTRPGVDRTLNYGYADKLGLRTSAYGTGKAPTELESVTTELTGFGRTRQREHNGLLRPRLADGTVSAGSEVILTLDGFDLPGLDIGFTGAKWRTELLLGVGSHKLDARAVTPGATAEVNDRHFVAEFHRDQVGETLSYDNSGNVTKRAYVWKDWKPDPKDASERDWKYDASGSDQLTWDAAGRLLKMTLSGGGRNADWSAVYDGFGRRLRTVYQVNGDSEQRIDVAYDPEVTFQELWTKIDGKRFWHVHGPDLSGGFGGMEGSGGLEWIIEEETGEATGILNDLFGNAIATMRGNSVTWNATRFTGYGAYPGLQVPVVENGASLAESIGWRGERLDPTGLYWLGHRYYDPNAGHFLSADPLGHSASLSLYDYCGGDPINCADPDGLLVRNAFVAGGDMLAGVGAGFTGHVSASTPNSGAANVGMLVGASISGWKSGWEGGRSIAINTFTFSASDKLGLTNSESYQGSEFTASRILATGSREIFIFAGTLGTAQAFRAGGYAAYGVAAGAGELYSTYQNIEAIKEGAELLGQGNGWGALQVGLGTVGVRGNISIYGELVDGISSVGKQASSGGMVVPRKSEYGGTSIFDWGGGVNKPLVLPQFTRTSIDAILASSRRSVGQTTEGARAIAKKLGHAQSGGYKSAFDGIKPTQANADAIIDDILNNPSRAFYGDKVIDVYGAAGRGVRFDKATNAFRGFLEGGLSTQ